ncbi:hypothetical protein [Acetobacter orientalis]|uniref:hypothetical protein n=1 Tax=Acetobacter orientalis TaxID=146474 RepID=UPI000A3BA547|nr:hypothetical protein [Acetobacter orientalis]
MNNVTLPAFSSEEFQRARLFLATQVADMMGRKLEEGDWAKVYCAAKGIPLSGWSNTDIDIIYGPLGVEQKAMCRKANQSIMEACGTRIMHPAGTRSIRFPQGEEDATKAAHNVLRQYGQLIANRTALVDAINRYHHGLLTREQAIAALQSGIENMSKASAEKRIPRQPISSNQSIQKPDMRFGWLLWQDSLREFLYFEEPMTAPDPSRYIGDWNERKASGSRKATRNLWIFDKETGEKHFSITTEAGVKIQPYFRVPASNDPNLYHFIVQGEDIGNGMVRVWLSQTTANLLRQALGSLDPQEIAKAIDAVKREEKAKEKSGDIFDPLAVEVLVPAPAYARMKATFEGVSDEHNFKQLIEILQSSASN